MILPAWIPLLLALPVLWLGEQLVRRIRLLSRFHIPAPVVGGIIISLLFLLGNSTGLFAAKFATKVDAPWWTWLVTTGTEWRNRPEKDVYLPFLVAFFTCIGLNASWSLVKRGSLPLVLLLLVSGALAVIQNLVGIGLTKILHVPPLLGIVCGSLTLTGGPGTALGLASLFEDAGLKDVGVFAIAAATFGLVTSSLVGGPLGGWLIRKYKLQPTVAKEVHLEGGRTKESGIRADISALAGFGKNFLLHLLLLLICIKLGAWLSYFLQEAKIKFPIYMGAMLLGVFIRNALDLSGRNWIRTEIVERISSVTLGIFLTTALMNLDLSKLASVAGPMLIILSVQVMVMILFAWLVTFMIAGRDYDAAVTATGHVGFGLGITANAVANMKALVERYGPAPRAFLIVPIVGGFLIDFVNTGVIRFFISQFK
ncbi:MAG: Sodium/glutamate symporter [Verrucomicrobiales bacterium]|nr:Sodium/glutamate symporter [Verrucomicrobiales bacterium]